MFYVGIFCLELFILYLLSRYISIELSRLFLRLFHSHKVSGITLAILFLPGTFIHEFAHLVMAVLVRVEATHFTLLPKIGVESIELGSVGIIKPDPIRRMLIGIAPFIFGTILILLGIHIFFLLKVQSAVFIFISIYSLFTISNTMFSSRRDLEGVLEFLLAVFIVFGLIYILGIRLQLPSFNLNPFFSLFEKGSKILLIPGGIDILFLCIIKTLNYSLKN